MAVINKNTEAIINLNEMIVSGDNSFNATLVAMKELPQKITARIINKFFIVRDFKKSNKSICLSAVQRDFFVFFAEE